MNGFNLPTLAMLALIFGMLWLALRQLRQEDSWFTTVHEWEHGLLYRHGRFVRALPPGRYFKPPYSGHTIFLLRRADTVQHVPTVDVISRDKLAYRLSASLTYRVIDPKLAHENGHGEQIRLAAVSGLVRLASERDLATLLSARASLDGALLALLPSPVCGCEVGAVVITGTALPPELRRLFSEIERARSEGQAALERARGETAALRSLANAARMLKGNPELMNLRVLQALSQPPGKSQPTLVLGAGSIQPIRLGGASDADEGSAGL